MAFSGTRITAPVQILGDLQPVLGTSYKGLGQIITNANINKWAKFKPTRATGQTRPTDYWKGRVNDNPQCCGLSQPISSSIASFMQTLASGGYAWTYLRPRGMSQSPQEWFRQMDFDGYEHSAICPLPVSPNGTVTYQQMHTFICSLPSQVDLGGLTLTDLYVSQISGNPNLKSCYIGLLLYNGSTRHWKTAIQTIAQGEGTSEGKHRHIAMDLSGMTGTWYARTFLCTTALGQDQTSGGGYCIACESLGTLTLTHISGDYSVTIEAKWLSRSQYKVTATFVNGKSASVSVTSMRIVIAFGLDQRTINIPNQTIAAGQDYAYTETYNYLYSSGGTATASANFGGTSKSATTNFIDP